MNSVFHLESMDANVLVNQLNPYCDNTIETLLNNSIKTLRTLKSHDYIEVMHCPQHAQIGWRAEGYTPFIFGTSCEPWWARDAVYILSHILNQNMHAVEYSTGASTVWLSMFVKDLISMENSRHWFNAMTNLTNLLNITNVHLMASYLDYVEIVDKQNYHTIDVVSVDGIKRLECMNYTIHSLIKPHGGIVVLDNSDREGDNGYNASTIVPKHWLRYDSTNLLQHVNRLETKRWLLNSRTTIWITRDKKCL